jgi:hypothetical protein
MDALEIREDILTRYSIPLVIKKGIIGKLKITVNQKIDA